MGTNRRYAAQIDARMDARILDRIASDGELQTLTAAELQLDILPLTIDPKPSRRVQAWVRFGATPVRVEAVAVRWTSTAVGIQFEAAGRTHRCWVWSGAVDEVTPG